MKNFALSSAAAAAAAAAAAEIVIQQPPLEEEITEVESLEEEDENGDGVISEMGMKPPPPLDEEDDDIETGKNDDDEEGLEEKENDEEKTEENQRRRDKLFSIRNRFKLNNNSSQVDQRLKRYGFKVSEGNVVKTDVSSQQLESFRNWKEMAKEIDSTLKKVLERQIVIAGSHSGILGSLLYIMSQLGVEKDSRAAKFVLVLQLIVITGAYMLANPILLSLHNEKEDLRAQGKEVYDDLTAERESLKMTKRAGGDPTLTHQINSLSLEVGRMWNSLKGTMSSGHMMHGAWMIILATTGLAYLWAIRKAF